MIHVCIALKEIVHSKNENIAIQDVDEFTSPQAILDVETFFIGTDLDKCNFILNKLINI